MGRGESHGYGDDLVLGRVVMFILPHDTYSHPSLSLPPASASILTPQSLITPSVLKSQGLI